MNSYSISFIPKSWAVGKKTARKKTTLALGPLRLSLSRDLPTWEEAKKRATASIAAPDVEGAIASRKVYKNEC